MTISNDFFSSLLTMGLLNKYKTQGILVIITIFGINFSNNVIFQRSKTKSLRAYILSVSMVLSSFTSKSLVNTPSGLSKSNLIIHIQIIIKRQRKSGLLEMVKSISQIIANEKLYDVTFPTLKKMIQSFQIAAQARSNLRYRNGTKWL